MTHECSSVQVISILGTFNCDVNTDGFHGRATSKWIEKPIPLVACFPREPIPFRSGIHIHQLVCIMNETRFSSTFMLKSVRC